jgi:hypothetical protein
MSEVSRCFDQQYSFGFIAESAIAKWLQSRGAIILPVYEKMVDDKIGPRVFSAERNYVAPDMLVYSHGKFKWIEVKHKSAFSWYHIGCCWVTGIDQHHFRDYLDLRKALNTPVWLLFLHEYGVAKDTPTGMVSPTGLFGDELLVLAAKINHVSERYGRHGMVYWKHTDLRKVATLRDVLGALEVSA